MTKRSVTSAIPGMSVPEVRKCLDHIRQRWKSAGSEPFYLTDIIPIECTTQLLPMSMQMLALQFVKGQHRKRHSKDGVE